MKSVRRKKLDGVRIENKDENKICENEINDEE